MRRLASPDIVALLGPVRRGIAGLLLAALLSPWSDTAARPAVSAALPPLLSMRMMDSSRGWALATHRCVLRTEDGGVHWSNVTPAGMPAGVEPQLPVAYFRTPLTAWVVAHSKVFRTVDGGRTWRSTMLETGDVFQITFVDARNGWLIAFLSGGMMSDLVEIFRTVDGGVTWVKAASAGDETMPPGAPSSGLPRSGKKYGIGFVNATTGWVVGYTPRPDFIYLYVTHDGGRTWREQDLPRPSGPSAEYISLPPTFFSLQRGVLPISVQPGAVIYVTRDGGTTWRPTAMAQASAYGRDAAFEFLDAGHWWIIGDAGLVATTDGGGHWEPRVRPDLGDLPRLNFASSTVGWAFSQDRAVLFRTADGGRRWTPLSFTVSPPCRR